MRLRFIHLIAAVSLFALGGCATPGPTPKELDALRAELRSVRDANLRLERRLERIEAHQAVIAARAGTPVAGTASSTGSPGAKKDEPREIPELAVVKLKPKKDPAPALPTGTVFVEPSEEILDALATRSFSREDNDDDDGDAKPTEVAADVQYEEAVNALRTGNVPGGVARLRTFADENPKHPRADNALFLAATGQIAIEELENAAESLERLLNRYPAGDAVLDAMLKLAECRIKLNQVKSARALYAEVISNYPGTPAANTAEQRLASLPPN